MDIYNHAQDILKKNKFQIQSHFKNEIYKIISSTEFNAKLLDKIWVEYIAKKIVEK